MTLTDAQRRYRMRQRRMQAWDALQMCILIAVLSVACGVVSGCLICEWKTPVLDLQLNGVIHKPVMDGE